MIALPSQAARYLTTPPQQSSRKESGSFSTASSSSCFDGSSSSSQSSQFTNNHRFLKQISALESPQVKPASQQTQNSEIHESFNSSNRVHNSSRVNTFQYAQMIVPRNLKSMNSIEDELDCSMHSSSSSSRNNSPWPMSQQPRSTSCSPRKQSAVQSRGEPLQDQDSLDQHQHQQQQQPLLQLFKCEALNTLESPKICLKLPALPKQNNECLPQKRISTTNNINQMNEIIHPICNMAPPAALSHKEAYKQRIFAFKKVFNAQKPQMSPSINNSPASRKMSSEQYSHRQPSSSLVNSPRKVTAFNMAFPSSESSPVSKCNERELVFIRLKFQQIDLLNSLMVSKQEVADFFEGRWVKHKNMNNSNNLSGFEHEEDILQSHIGVFLRSVSEAITERNGLINQREFGKLMRDFFDSVRVVSDEQMLDSTHSVDWQQSPRKSLQQGSAGISTIHKQITVKRRQLKSAQILREKALTPLEESSVSAIKNSFNITKEFKQQHRTGNSHSPPHLKAVVIPKLRSLSIKSIDDNIRKFQMRAQNNNYEQQYECKSEPVIEFQLETPKKQQNTPDVVIPPFDCTFQPHHFQWSQNSSNYTEETEATRNSTTVTHGEHHVIDPTPFLQTFNANSNNCHMSSIDSQNTAQKQRDCKELQVEQISLKSGKKQAIDAIDQNCSNFLFKKEVKVFKKPVNRKTQHQEELNKQPLTSEERANARKDLVKKLDRMFISEMEGKHE